jgi:hypothetical protein
MTVPARRGAAAESPQAGPVAHPVPAQAPDPARRQPTAHRAPAAPGPDIGWALVCLGLLLAAALMGTRGDGGRTAGGVSARVGAMLRPLMGRG